MSLLWQNDDEVLNLVDEISSKCDTCKKYKKALLTQVVGLPLAN